MVNLFQKFIFSFDNILFLTKGGQFLLIFLDSACSGHQASEEEEGKKTKSQFLNKGILKPLF